MMHRKSIIAIIESLVSLVGALSILAGCFYFSDKWILKKEKIIKIINQQRALYLSIRMNDSIDSTLLTASKFKDLIVISTADNQEIQIRGPHELFTTRWILIVYGKDGHVVGKSIRNDDVFARPCDAPEDQGQVKPPTRVLACKKRWFGL